MKKLAAIIKPIPPRILSALAKGENFPCTTISGINSTKSIDKIPKEVIAKKRAKGRRLAGGESLMILP
jgi:hypothetical protein